MRWLSLSKFLVGLLLAACFLVYLCALAFQLKDNVNTIVTSEVQLDSFPVPDFTFRFDWQFSIGCIFQTTDNAINCSNYVTQPVQQPDQTYQGYFLAAPEIFFAPGASSGHFWSSQISFNVTVTDPAFSKANDTFMSVYAIDSENDPIRDQSVPATPSTQSLINMNSYILANHQYYTFRPHRTIKYVSDDSSLSLLGLQFKRSKKSFITGEWGVNPYPRKLANDSSYVSLNVYPETFIATVQTEERLHTVLTLLGLLGGGILLELMIFGLIFGFGAITPCFSEEKFCWHWHYRKDRRESTLSETNKGLYDIENIESEHTQPQYMPRPTRSTSETSNKTFGQQTHFPSRTNSSSSKTGKQHHRRDGLVVETGKRKEKQSNENDSPSQTLFSQDSAKTLQPSEYYYYQTQAPPVPNPPRNTSGFGSLTFQEPISRVPEPVRTLSEDRQLSSKPFREPHEAQVGDYLGIRVDELILEQTQSFEGSSSSAARNPLVQESEGDGTDSLDRENKGERKVPHLGRIPGSIKGQIGGQAVSSSPTELKSDTGDIYQPTQSQDPLLNVAPPEFQEPSEQRIIPISVLEDQLIKGSLNPSGILQIQRVHDTTTSDQSAHGRTGLPRIQQQTRTRTSRSSSTSTTTPHDSPLHRRSSGQSRSSLVSPPDVYHTSAQASQRHSLPSTSSMPQITPWRQFQNIPYVPPAKPPPLPLPPPPPSENLGNVPQEFPRYNVTPTPPSVRRQSLSDIRDYQGEFLSSYTVDPLPRQRRIPRNDRSEEQQHGLNRPSSPTDSQLLSELIASSSSQQQQSDDTSDDPNIGQDHEEDREGSPIDPEYTIEKFESDDETSSQGKKE